MLMSRALKRPTHVTWKTLHTSFHSTLPVYTTIFLVKAWLTAIHNSGYHICKQQSDGTSTHPSLLSSSPFSSSPFFPATCSLIKSSTQPSTSSALCANHSHHFSLLVSAGGSALVTLGGVGLAGASSDREGVVSSRPEAEAAMLPMDPIVADIVAKDGAALRECTGGSDGVSSCGAEESLWWPEGVRGRRRVPLLGAGEMWMESQIMLYNSMFSERSVSRVFYGDAL